jgi:hypothetical protein
MPGASKPQMEIKKTQIATEEEVEVEEDVVVVEEEKEEVTLMEVIESLEMTILVMVKLIQHLTLGPMVQHLILQQKKQTLDGVTSSQHNLQVGVIKPSPLKEMEARRRSFQVYLSIRII